jgi:hypothetical protein
MFTDAISSDGSNTKSYVQQQKSRRPSSLPLSLSVPSSTLNPAEEGVAMSVNAVATRRFLVSGVWVVLFLEYSCREHTVFSPLLLVFAAMQL